MVWWIHIHGKFTLDSNFHHFTELGFTSVLSQEFLFKLNPRNFPFRWENNAEIVKFFTQNHRKWAEMSITHFSFHANGEKWNHVHAQFNHSAILSQFHFRLQTFSELFCVIMVRHPLLLMLEAGGQYLTCITKCSGLLLVHNGPMSCTICWSMMPLY